MSPHYDRNFAVSPDRSRVSAAKMATDEEAVVEAAEALREVEVEAAQIPSLSNADDLDSISVDELRKIAAALGVPNRARVTEREDLVAAIRARR